MKKWEAANAKGTVIIVHGTGEHMGRYQWLAEQWNKQHFHVIVGDLPGNGNSPGKKGHVSSFQWYLDTVEKWYTEARKDRLPIFLLGHSLGGLIVIRALMERKLEVAGVILSSPCLGLVNPPPLGKRVGAKLVHRVLPSVRADSGIKFDLVTRNEEIRKEYESDELLVLRVSVRWYQEMRKAMKKSFEEIKQFPNIPLLLMQAGDDLVVDKFASREWFNSLPLEEKAYKEWPVLYHEIFNEPERDKVFQHALNFAKFKCHHP